MLINNVDAKIICVDIDGTLLYSKLVDDKYVITGANADLINQLNQGHDEGCIIILQTGRHWKHLMVTKQQLKKVGVKYDTVVFGKPPADVYIDDKAIRPDEL